MSYVKLLKLHRLPLYGGQNQTVVVIAFNHIARFPQKFFADGHLMPLTVMSGKTSNLFPIDVLGL